VQEKDLTAKDGDTFRDFMLVLGFCPRTDNNPKQYILLFTKPLSQRLFGRALLADKIIVK
jgi:hypothetical protein